MKFLIVFAHVLSVVGLAAASGPLAAQQDYPRKPIRWISPYPPGGSTSTLARLVGDKLGETLGKPVIVDNRPGANTMIGSEAAARATPDGYTLLHAGKAQVILNVTSKPPYDVFKDFAPITALVRTHYILVVNPGVPVSNLQEFIAYAKARPKKLAVASVSTGTGQHLMGELFNIQAGVSMRHIPYKGGQQGLVDLMGGIVQVAFSNAINAIPHVKSGKLKGLAITGEKRTAALPDLPTYAEAGMPSYAPKTWQGVVAPAGTPKAIIERLSSEMAKIVAIPVIVERLENSGMDPWHTGPAKMAAQMKEDYAETLHIIKTANIKLD
jgi:tripartite-type tricarboxylate transporter receptor subunit TctC